MKNLNDFLNDMKGKEIKFWVYKKIFTPYEQEHKFMDESIYEDTTAQCGFIEDAYEIVNDILLKIAIKDESDNHILFYNFYKMSDINFCLYAEDDIDEEDNKNIDNLCVGYCPICGNPITSEGHMLCWNCKKELK